MLILYSHLSWFLFLALLLLLSSALLVYVLYAGQSVSLSLACVSLNGSPLKLSFLFDTLSMPFVVVVLLISSVVMLYSYNYMAPYSNPSPFLWLTFLFIVSMLLVVCMSSLFFLMLGWDGLGLISFLLIVFYQNQSAVTSGLFTLLMNRVGDCFFLVSLGILFLTSSNVSFSHFPYASSYVLSFLLLITFMTNSAIFPFSAWLPLAIAAPTPISALVHSSTLVTAGLYLMMRFSVFFTYFPLVLNSLLVLSLFTSFYAGVNAAFETDLNNLIALSTLSHLGFIGLAFSVGLTNLAFFHLLTHALFKSLLFMTMGDIMTNLSHSQDIRFLSSGCLQTPGSCFLINTSLLNLLGIPSLSGFFSNDLILEGIHYSNISCLVAVILYLNVALTYFYTYQLFYYSFQSHKSSPYALVLSPVTRLHVVLLITLCFCSLSFSGMFFSLIYPSVLFTPISPLFNFLPLLLSLALWLLLTLNNSQFKSFSPSAWFFLSKMGGLSLFTTGVMSSVYYHASLSAVRLTEQGLASHLINSIPHTIVVKSSKLLIIVSSAQSINVMVFLLPLMVTLWFIL